MKKRQAHRNRSHDRRDPSGDLFDHLQVPFSKSREEAWREIHAAMKHSAASGQVRILEGRGWMAVAASLALLLSAAAFARFYRVETSAHPGEHKTVSLPDGSVADLNAQTSLSFHPIWWRVNRNIVMSGEAFFTVKDGKRFTVATSLGRTEVLGTAFNVYSRENRFRVTCHSGRVQVLSAGAESGVTLGQDEMAELDRTTGAFDVSHTPVDRISPDWKMHRLIFRSTPLREVFDEIERQYGIRIETAGGMDHLYTGNFSMDRPVEKVLSLVCRPFDLGYEKKRASEYDIFPATQE